MTNHAVVIAGGGPTGLMLASELALAGVDVAIVERRETQTLAGSRAGGLSPRTLELLDLRGLADRFVAEGTQHPFALFGSVQLSLADAPTRHPYLLALWQNHVERLLAERVAEQRVPILRGVEVTGFAQDADGVDVALSDGRTLRARYLVGCDGGRSAVRKHAGIAFAGTDASASYLIAEATLADEPAWGFRRDARGLHAIGKGDGGRARLVLEEGRIRDAEPTPDELRAALVAIYGTDFGIHDVVWLSWFTDAARQAAAYRERRVLLAGDAAHVHSPIGGQGMNLGMQDAMNLGWKLARVVAGAPDALLDTYHAERHPVGARVLRVTLAQTALRRGDAQTLALLDQLRELLALDEPRRRHAALMTGLDIRYDLGDGHPLLGRRMPDLDLVTADGPRRVSSLLHAGRAVLLDFAAGAVRHDGPWELPAVGAVPPPPAVLIRPDGYVAWVGDGTDRGLADALRGCGGDAV